MSSSLRLFSPFFSLLELDVSTSMGIAIGALNERPAE
jgi:hypothetical protein